MDLAILDFIQERLRTPLLDDVMIALTHLGDLALVWLVAGAVLLAQPKRRQYGAAVILAVVATAAIGMLVLKPLFDRPRPFVAHEFLGLLVPPPLGTSFPSNHSMVSFAAATAICCIPEGGRGVKAVKTGALVVAALIAISRIYLYVHYPSDILVGAIVGVGLGLASVWVVKRLWSLRGRGSGGTGPDGG
ncbi:phosphatase PAP2 family protein [Arabiibacter massiliensis]|uniref:phosphatase PAP2 family protein n=1 Tax=Arabiibacter massiliensis TaxID=1870985 RepID=UPI0009BA79B5|nr:phosphatase PAP2 family protein [Arabiibacter massiliensis]